MASIRLKSVSRVGRDLAGLFLPGACCLCQGEVTHYRSPDVLCGSCRNQLSSQKKCPRCAAVLAHENALPTDHCPWCHHLKLPFDGISSVGNYVDDLREAILHAKTNRGTAAAWDLGQLLGRDNSNSPEVPPIIIPVPMHWTRRIRRGTNTSLILAQSFSRRTGWPIGRLVRFRRAVAKQSELSFTARSKNVRGAFQVTGPVPTDRPIVLVDDIMTTGSTLTELGRTLRQVGAAEIHVAVVARSTPEYVTV